MFQSSLSKISGKMYQQHLDKQIFLICLFAKNENNNYNNNNKQKIVVITSDNTIFATNLSFSFRPIAPFQSCGKLAAARQ